MCKQCKPRSDCFWSRAVWSESSLFAISKCILENNCIKSKNLAKKGWNKEFKILGHLPYCHCGTILWDGTSFPTILHVWPAKTQISLCRCADWTESLQGTVWVGKGPKHLQVDSEDWSDSMDMQADLCHCWEYMQSFKSISISRAAVMLPHCCYNITIILLQCYHWVTAMLL